MINDRAASLPRHAEPVAPPSAIAALREATWPSHQRLEKRIDVKSRFHAPAPYRAHLQSLWGFCAALEEGVGADRFGDALPDYPARRKLALLAHDLADLGLAPADIERLPRCTALRPPASIAAAFGCVYVLEGATLGGRTLLPVVEQRLGLSATSGARFLASYGDAVAPMWARFGAAVDAWCHDDERRRCAQAAAIATFGALEDWLCRAAA